MLKRFSTVYSYHPEMTTKEEILGRHQGPIESVPEQYQSFCHQGSRRSAEAAVDIIDKFPQF
jgi:hypothetical protein